MRVIRFSAVMALIAQVSFFSFLPAVLAAPAAQSGNLVANPGFETPGAGGYGEAPASWQPWWAETAKNPELNYWSKPRWTLESLDNFAPADRIYAGKASARVITNWDPWWAGLKQTVTAPAGARVRLTAVARAWAASEDWPAPSDTAVPVSMAVGLEPNGSADQFAGSVVWSGGISPHNTWQTVAVEATVGASGKVTVILSGQFPKVSRLWLGTLWDDVSLTVVSTGPAPAPTTAPSSGGNTGGQTPQQPVATAVPFVMPTPGTDGNIVYVVQSGDTGWSIAAQAGLSLQQLSDLNGGVNLNFLTVGQRLVIGQGQPSVSPTATAAPAATLDPNAPTAAPQPTATSPAAAQPTAAAETGTLCAKIYEDLNGNALREEGESAVAGGSLTLIDAASGAPVQAYTTQAGEDQHCFEGIAPGVYTLAAAPPAGYNATTSANMRLEVQPSASVNIEFGAQKGSGGTPTAAADEGDGRLRVALFGAAGIMLILLAAGIAGFLMLRRR